MTSQQTVLVTGGASGIGLAIVREALQQGWRVISADLDAGQLEQARVEFAGAVHCEQLDVADEKAVIDTVARCEAQIGPLTGLVNSAGIGKDVPCLDTSAELFRRILEVNLIGSFVMAREVARRMRERRQGAIVNIASVSGLLGNRGRVAYGASKAGVISMTEVMAVELASCGIRVNAIAPGPIETPLVSTMHSEESRRAWISMVPQHRYAAPEEVAGAALFLLDDSKSSFITGQTLCVDGGFSTAGLM